LGGTPRSLLAATITAALLTLLAAPGQATITVGLSGQALVLIGSDQGDVIQVRMRPSLTDPASQDYQIHDDTGVPGSLPPQCQRFNAQTALCPVASFSEIQMDLGGGTDTNVADPDIAVPLRVDGGAGNDRLSGAGSNDAISGDAGKDTIKGVAGKDKLNGGTGNDKLNGGDGADKLIGGPGAHDKCIGGPGHNSLTGCETGH
jgi:Ca2+-binding RTX toxin-like protein